MQALRDVPRGRVPGEVELAPVAVPLDQKLHHADHLGRVLLRTVEVGDPIAGQFERRRQDQAAARLLPLGTTRCSPGAHSARPGRILTAKGPNSSVEKKASSGPSPDRMERMRSTFAV